MKLIPSEDNNFNNKIIFFYKTCNESVLIKKIFLFMQIFILFFIFLFLYIIKKEIKIIYKNSLLKSGLREPFPKLIIEKDDNPNNLGKSLKYISSGEIKSKYRKLIFESKFIFLTEINKKRTFKKRFPLPKFIKCFQHIREGGLMDMIAFISFLTKDTIFFEFGSGCTSVIAKYYTKKSYAVEGNINWYKEGIKNGLKDNIIFKDIKAIKMGGLWSQPGHDSNLENWKNYFQAYKKEYNADVIFIDGRFRVACAFDIFNKINDSTIILIHEYNRKSYLIIEKYYKYIYHWDTIFLFKKKSNIKEIPIEFQKLFWNDST